MDQKQYVTSPRGSFRIGAILGMAMLWGANAIGTLPTIITSIFFPSPLIDLTMGWFERLASTFCADVASGSDAAFLDFCAQNGAAGAYHTVATIWIYMTVGIYYGILGVFLVRLYRLAKKRTDW